MIKKPGILFQFELNAASDPALSPPGWFFLSEGNLCINLPNACLYEYSKASQLYFHDNTTHYHYYLGRFFEDLQDILEQVAIKLPETFSSYVSDFTSFQKFKRTLRRYLYTVDNGDELEEKLASWIYKRAIPAEYLHGGPTVWFFRFESSLRIIWNADHRLNRQTHLWTFPFGQCTMDFQYFMDQTKLFADSFFGSMAEKIIATPNIQNQHRDHLLTTNSQIQSVFRKYLNGLSHPIEYPWAEIQALLAKITDSD